MAREAIARLYDVDKSSIVYTKPDVRGRYDHGTIAFRAKDERQIGLDKIHESVWATRLSRGTRSALVALTVTVVGDVSTEDGQTTLRVPGAKGVFVLEKSAQEEKAAQFDQLQAALARGEQIVSVTGRLDGWVGKWPTFLNGPPPETNRIFVSQFKTASTLE